MSTFKAFAMFALAAVEFIKKKYTYKSQDPGTSTDRKQRRAIYVFSIDNLRALKSSFTICSTLG